MKEDEENFKTIIESIEREDRYRQEICLYHNFIMENNLKDVWDKWYAERKTE